MNYSDEELVKMIRQRGKAREDAFVFLMRNESQGQKISRILTRYGAADIDCEEIFDDALVALEAYINKGGFDKGGVIEAFLVDVSKKLWYKRFRKKTRTTEYEFDDAMEQGEYAESAESLLIKDEVRQQLITLLEQIGESCRQLLTLSFLEEKKNAEIVEIMNYKDASVAAVMKSKCLKKLIEFIKARPQLAKLYH